MRNTISMPYLSNFQTLPPTLTSKLEILDKWEFSIQIEMYINNKKIYMQN